MERSSQPPSDGGVSLHVYTHTPETAPGGHCAFTRLYLFVLEDLKALYVHARRVFLSLCVLVET